MIRQLLIFFLLLVPAIVFSQNILQKQVRLSRQSGTVGELLDALNMTDSVSLSYSSGVISLGKRVTLTGRESTVEDYLRSILKEQPVKYVVENKKIFLVFDERSPFKKKITVSGYITDEKSGERLTSASIYALNKREGTASNNYGFYSITLDSDSIDLSVSHAGYLSFRLSLRLQKDTIIDIALPQHVIINEIVVVNADAKRNAENRTLPGKISIPVAVIKSVPSLMGEPDVLKTLQLLPGIQAGNEGSTALNVRGGSADQNLILLDGVPVYNASHAFGLFSIFNADAVHNVEVMKGGFPASYGGRLSSIVDVQIKEGDKYAFHGEGGLGLIFSRLTLEGPLKKGKSSFLVSGRRTYADLILRPILKSTNGKDYDFGTAFSDLNLKTNFSLGRKDHLYFSIYTGIDKFYNQDAYSPYMLQYPLTLNRYGFSWGNNTAMLRWNHLYSKKMFSNLTFNYSRFRFKAYDRTETTDRGILVSKGEQQYFSSIKDLVLKYDFDYLPDPRHFIKMGAAVTLHNYRPGVNQYYLKDSIVKLDETIDNNSLYTGEYDLYAEDDVRLTGRMKANIGIRLSGFSVQSKVFVSVQPRINWLYKLDNKWSIKASAVKMNQYIHLLTNSNLGLPTDLWVPVTRRVRPQVSYQVTAGISYSHDKSLEASAEVYYKHLKNVIEYAEGVGFNNANSAWEDIVEMGKGKTYGAEWLLQKKKGELTGLISYTLSWSRRRFKNINEGKSFPYKYDRRHEVKMALVWQPGKRFEFSCDWIFATGNAISLPKLYYYDPYATRFIDVYTGRNDFRMPVYHRMDLSMKFIKQKRRYLRSWVISIYNVYNQLNTFFIYHYSSDYNYQDEQFRKLSLFPILPSVAYQFKF